jgi:FdhD protein
MGKLGTQNGTCLQADRVGELIELLSEVQNLYRESGGVHTSALSDGERILIAAEDIGRHNTLDKIAGRYIMERISPVRKIILTTGRISSEMIQKAGRIGAGVVISHTSPSSLSVQMADELGITLIGYARRDRFRIYTHPEGIVTAPTMRTE